MSVSPSSSPVTVSRGAGPSPARLAAPLRPLLGDALALALLGATFGLSYVGSLWLVEGLDLLLLLWLPGALLLRAVGVAPESARRNPVYGIAASLGVLIAAALLVNSVGPGLGVSRPLERLPLLCSLGAIELALILLARVRPRPGFIAYVPRIDRLRGLTIALAVLPALAALGALWLTNDHGSGAAVVAAILAGALMLVSASLADRLDHGRCMALLYFASIALIFSFSLRGRFVYGSDILGEYHDFVGVLGAHRWSIHPKNTAYYAMMSITTLPTLLSAVSGAAPLFILKFVYPAILGLFPVGVFVVGSRFGSHRAAFAATLVLAVQSYLFEEMPAIARQIIALVFFIALLAAICDGDLRPAARRGLIVVFGLGLVLSHYSTTYFTLIMLAVGIIVELVRRLVLRGPSIPIADLALAVGAIAIGAFVWYVPVTHSTSNVSDVISSLRSHGLSLLPGSHTHHGLGTYISGNLPSAVSPARLQRLAVAQYHHADSYVKPLHQAAQPRWALQSVSLPSTPLRAPHVTNALTLLNTIVNQLVNVLAVIASVAVVVRRRANPYLRVVALIGVGTLGGLVAIRLSGTIASDYNQERAFLQAFVPLAICIAWLLSWCRGRRLFAVLPAVFPLALMVIFVGASGLEQTAIGGVVPANLSNTGLESTRFIVDEPELAGAGWVERSAGTHLLYADRYAQLRIIAATGRGGGILTAIMPRTLDRYAWIYADADNVRSDTVSGQVSSSTAAYRFPRFVDKYWNRVYADGYSAGYNRG